MNAPARLPPWEFVLGLAAKVLWLLGVFQSFAYHFLVWLVVVPFITHWIWEFCFFKGFSEAQSLFMSHLNATTIFTDCLHGFFLSLGMAYVFLGITFIRVVLPLDPRGALGLANGNFAANENGENVGGRQGIARVLQTIKRSLVFLANWWKISVARIMVYLGIVENAVLNELLNVQAPFFLFKENAFVVSMLSSLLLPFMLVSIFHLVLLACVMTFIFNNSYCIFSTHTFWMVRLMLQSKKFHTFSQFISKLSCMVYLSDCGHSYLLFLSHNSRGKK